MTLHSNSPAFRRFTKHYNETEAYLLADDRALHLKKALPHRAKWSQDIMHDIVMVAMQYRPVNDPDAKNAIVYDSSPLFEAVKRVKKHLEKARGELARAERRSLDALNWLRLTSNSADEITFPDVAAQRIAQLIELADTFERDRPMRVHGRTGKPIPHQCVEDLSAIFEKSAGKRAGTGKGPFAKFVQCFWDELGNERGYHTVVKDIQKAMLYRTRHQSVRTSAQRSTRRLPQPRTSPRS